VFHIRRASGSSCSCVWSVNTLPIRECMSGVLERDTKSRQSQRIWYSSWTQLVWLGRNCPSKGECKVWNNMERLTHKGARDLDYIGWGYQHILYKETPIRSWLYKGVGLLKRPKSITDILLHPPQSQRWDRLRLCWNTQKFPLRQRLSKSISHLIICRNNANTKLLVSNSRTKW
jgi:hypothetical protein